MFHNIFRFFYLVGTFLLVVFNILKILIQVLHDALQFKQILIEIFLVLRGDLWLHKLISSIIWLLTFSYVLWSWLGLANIYNFLLFRILIASTFGSLPFCSFNGFKLHFLILLWDCLHFFFLGIFILNKILSIFLNLLTHRWRFIRYFLAWLIVFRA